MTLRTAIAQLQVHALAAGAKEAPTDPTEGNMAWPFSVVYPGSGTIVAETAGAEKDLVTVHLDLHVNRANLPTDVQAVLSFYEAFKALLIGDPTLAGTVDTIVMTNGQPIRWQFGQMQYASVDTLGIRYFIQLKQKN